MGAVREVFSVLHAVMIPAHSLGDKVLSPPATCPAHVRRAVAPLPRAVSARGRGGCAGPDPQRTDCAHFKTVFKTVLEKIRLPRPRHCGDTRTAQAAADQSRSWPRLPRGCGETEESHCGGEFSFGLGGCEGSQLLGGLHAGDGGEALATQAFGDLDVGAQAPGTDACASRTALICSSVAWSARPSLPDRADPAPRLAALSGHPSTPTEYWGGSSASRCTAPGGTAHQLQHRERAGPHPAPAEASRAF
ncbi:hypothetical protein SAMN05428939_0132 [Streptomyces sp. TLI_105]|nr:hypothetical protein SAMN05428939_0132 [Streptomyces sp. TLI_105]